MLCWIFHRKDLHRRDWWSRTAWCADCNGWRPWGIADRINLWRRMPDEGSPLTMTVGHRCTPWTTAAPVYCHACGTRIALPGTFKIVQGFSYHDDCEIPYFGPRPITVAALGEGGSTNAVD